jgi:hypothetical protein
MGESDESSPDKEVDTKPAKPTFRLDLPKQTTEPFINFNPYHILSNNSFANSNISSAELRYSDGDFDSLKFPPKKKHKRNGSGLEAAMLPKIAEEDSVDTLKIPPKKNQNKNGSGHKELSKIAEEETVMRSEWLTQTFVIDETVSPPQGLTLPIDRSPYEDDQDPRDHRYGYIRQHSDWYHSSNHDRVLKVDQGYKKFEKKNTLPALKSESDIPELENSEDSDIDTARPLMIESSRTGPGGPGGKKKNFKLQKKNLTIDLGGGKVGGCRDMGLNTISEERSRGLVIGGGRSRGNGRWQSEPANPAEYGEGRAE